MSAYIWKLRVGEPDGSSRKLGDVSLPQMLGVVVEPACALCVPEEARALETEKLWPVHPSRVPSKPNVRVENSGGSVSAPSVTRRLDGAGLFAELAVRVNGTPADAALPRLKRNWQGAVAPPFRFGTVHRAAGANVTPGCVVLTDELTDPDGAVPELRS